MPVPLCTSIPTNTIAKVLYLVAKMGIYVSPSPLRLSETAELHSVAQTVDCPLFQGHKTGPKPRANPLDPALLHHFSF